MTELSPAGPCDLSRRTQGDDREIPTAARAGVGLRCEHRSVRQAVANQEAARPQNSEYVPHLRLCSLFRPDAHHFFLLDVIIGQGETLPSLWFVLSPGAWRAWSSRSGVLIVLRRQLRKGRHRPKGRRRCSPPSRQQGEIRQALEQVSRQYLAGNLSAAGGRSLHFGDLESGSRPIPMMRATAALYAGHRGISTC